MVSFEAWVVGGMLHFTNYSTINSAINNANANRKRFFKLIYREI